MAKITTFLDDNTVIMELLGPPNINGLCKCTYNGKTYVRHKNRVQALDEEARSILNGK